MKNTEQRFYLINPDNLEANVDVNDLSDAEFMGYAEELGTVFSLGGFIRAFKDEEVNPFTQFLRVINVEIPE